jgi:CheY-like chemotaxis protein
LGKEIELPDAAAISENKFLFIEKNPAIAHCFELLFFHRHAQVVVAKDSEEAQLLISRINAANSSFRACFIASGGAVTDEFLNFCAERQIPCIGLMSQSDMLELQGGNIARRMKYVMPKLANFEQFEDAIHHATRGDVSEIPLHTIYEQFDRTNLRVLVAEDNQVNQLVIEKVLAGFGCTITIAKTGKQAVAIYEENPGGFDIVFMDCEMPELNGFEATRRLRQFEVEHRLKRIPVVALTAHMDDEVIGHINDQGMDDYLAKPIDRRKIHHKLCKFSL